MKSKKTTSNQSRRHRQVATGPEAALARHRAQCRICRHAQREEIEQEFLDWVPASEIAVTYKLGSHRAVYRHANALDLFRMRRGYVERVLDNLLERSGEAKITAASIVAAVRLVIDLRSSGNWVYLKAMRSPLSAPSSGAARQSPGSARERGDRDDSEEDRENMKRAARSGYAAGARVRDEDGGRENTLWANASPQLRRALEAAEKRKQAQAAPVAPAVLAPAPAERNASPSSCAPKETQTKTELPGPTAPALPPPVRTPATPEPGMRQEQPEGPPQVAGMAWPWGKGNKPFARRGRWRGRPVVG